MSWNCNRTLIKQILTALASECWFYVSGMVSHSLFQAYFKSTILQGERRSNYNFFHKKHLLWVNPFPCSFLGSGLILCLVPNEVSERAHLWRFVCSCIEIDHHEYDFKSHKSSYNVSFTFILDQHSGQVCKQSRENQDLSKGKWN